MKNMTSNKVISGTKNSDGRMSNKSRGQVSHRELLYRVRSMADDDRQVLNTEQPEF